MQMLVDSAARVGLTTGGMFKECTAQMLISATMPYGKGDFNATHMSYLLVDNGGLQNNDTRLDLGLALAAGLGLRSRNETLSSRH